MTTRMPLPVTLPLAEGLAREGCLFGAAARLAALDDPVLRPLSALLLDILSPLLAMGAVKMGATGRCLDTDAARAFAVGGLRLDETALGQMHLATLAAGYRGWRDLNGRMTTLPPDATFLADMLRTHPDTDKETP